MLLSIDSGRICHASFRNSSEDAVTLRVFDHSRGIPFHPLSIAVVSFHAGQRGSLFMSAVLDVDYPEDSKKSPRLVLAMPRELFQAERRTLIRIPLSSESQLSVRIHTRGGRKWRPRPIDICLGGCQLEFDSSQAMPDWEVDRQVRVELAMRGRKTVLAGAVRWRNKGRLGVTFPEVVQGNKISPPQELRSLIEKVEREWLQQGVLKKPAA